jgi:hypothetical protein
MRGCARGSGLPVPPLSTDAVIPLPSHIKTNELRSWGGGKGGGGGGGPPVTGVHPKRF